MYKLFFLMMLISVAGYTQASVFGEHSRASDVAENYPALFTVTRFSGAVVDGVNCEWENAGKFALRTDRGNIDLSSFLVAPSAIKVSCAGKQPFYIFSIDRKYLEGSTSSDDVAVWFGKTRDRFGCEGYTGCDQVHVIHTYHNTEAASVAETGLQEW